MRVYGMRTGIAISLSSSDRSRLAEIAAVGRLVTTQRMSSPSAVASILAETRRLHPHDLAP
jgi:hypothetical protein